MSTVIETGVGAINYGKQSAKGTIATAATTTVGYNRLKHVGGGLKSGKKLGKENYTDGQRFPSPSVWVDRVGGDVGQITLELQPENIGLFYAQVLGSDVVTGASDPYTHTITPSNSGGTWGTWWQKVGSAVGPQREAYWDAKIKKFVQNSPRERNSVHAELDIAALKAAQAFTTDPAKTEDTSDPWLLTEASGALTFDGTVVSDIEDSIIEISTGIEAFFGDGVEPLQLIEGRDDVGISRSIQAIVTDDTLGKYRKALYNSTSPSAGDRPGGVVFAPAISQVFTRSVTRTATITNPKVAIDPANFDEMGPQPEGGKKAITFGGQCLKSGGSPQITVEVLSADATAYA